MIELQEKLELRLHRVGRELKSISDLINRYELDQSCKVPDRQPFKKGAQYITQFLKIDSESVLNAVKEDIIQCERDMQNVGRKKKDPIK